MFHSINTQFGSIENITISTGSIKIPTSILPYLTQADLDTIIKELISIFDENISKRMVTITSEAPSTSAPIITTTK